MANLGIVSLNGKQIEREGAAPVEEKKGKAKKATGSTKKKAGEAATEKVEVKEKKPEIVGIIARPPKPLVEEAPQPVEAKVIAGPPKRGLGVGGDSPAIKPIGSNIGKPIKGIEVDKNFPREAMHYRAVGILKGRVLKREDIPPESKVEADPTPIPEANETGDSLGKEAAPRKRKYRREYVLEVDGQTYPVYNKKKELERYIKKNIGVDRYWKVYPWYQIVFEDGKPVERVLGFELAALINDESRSNLKVESGLFSIRGVISESKGGTLKVKVFRNNMVNEKTLKAPKFIDEERTRKPVSTKIEVKGTIPPSKNKLGWFWDFTLKLIDKEFIYIEGKPLLMIHEIKRPGPGMANYQKKQGDAQVNSKPIGERAKVILKKGKSKEEGDGQPT